MRPMLMNPIPIGIAEGQKFNYRAGRAMSEKIKRCMICAKPSEETICESCKANVQGESLDKKMKVENKVSVGEEVLKKKRED